MRLIVVSALLLFASASASFGQSAYRVDPSPVMTTFNCQTGALCPALLVPGSTVVVCSYPACAAPITTYTDGTAGTPCPSYAPVTLPGSLSCTGTTGNQGQFGFWVTSGTFMYSITPPNGSQTLYVFTAGAITAGVSSLDGRTGAVSVIASDITSAAQDIQTTASPTFVDLNLTGTLAAASAAIGSGGLSSAGAILATGALSTGGNLVVLSGDILAHGNTGVTSTAPCAQYIVGVCVLSGSGGGGGVTFFNGRNGNVTLAAVDITNAAQNILPTAVPTFAGLISTGNVTVAGTLGVTGTTTLQVASVTNLGMSGTFSGQHAQNVGVHDPVQFDYVNIEGPSGVGSGQLLLNGATVLNTSNALTVTAATISGAASVGSLSAGASGISSAGAILASGALSTGGNLVVLTGSVLIHGNTGITNTTCSSFLDGICIAP